MRQLLQNTNFRSLTKALKKFPKVDAAYLFGSHASGSPQEDSDIDIGLLGRKEALLVIKMDILKELASQGFTSIDLVIFEEAPILLQYEIIHNNYLLFARKSIDTSSLFSLTLRRFWDFKHMLTAQADIYKEKLIHG